jgi:hypothetical protein
MAGAAFRAMLLYWRTLVTVSVATQTKSNSFEHETFGGGSPAVRTRLVIRTIV